MSNPDTGKPTRLLTGETITVRECSWRGEDQRWEASALVPRLPGAADRHSVGATPEESARNLQDYIQSLSREENLDG